MDTIGFNNDLENAMPPAECLIKQASADALEFEVPGLPEMVSCIRTRVAEFAGSMPFSEQDVDDIKLAVGEACTNALRHGRNGGQCPVTVKMERHKDSLTVYVADEGCGFDPENVSVPKPGELAERGRGIMFMRLLMDDVRFYFDHPGTRVELVKRFSGSQ